MKNTEFEKLLTQSLHDTPRSGNGLKNTVRLAKSQVGKNQKRGRIPFWRFLFQQVRYVGWQLWTAQGLMLLVFDRMLIQLYGERFWDSPISGAKLLFCASTLVAMMALPMLYRSRKYRMQEIESVSYFSSTRLLMAKLAAIGIGDALLLAGIFLTTMIRTSMETGNLTLCLLLPFLVMSAAYLYMMGHCSGNGFFVGSITLGSAMLLIATVIPGQWLSLFQQSMTYGWIIFCLGLLVFSAGQLRYLLYRSPYAELQVL